MKLYTYRFDTKTGVISCEWEVIRGGMKIGVVRNRMVIEYPIGIYKEANLNLVFQMSTFYDMTEEQLCKYSNYCERYLKGEETYK